MNTEQELRDAVVAVARLFPRETPAPGGAATVHQFAIDAGTVWALDKALRQLDDAIAEGRRSSDEQAEVVGWRARRWGSSQWELFAYDPRSLKQFSFFEPVYASPPAVAAGGVTAEAIIAALKATEFHRSQIQGFYAKDAGTHYIRDCTKPHDQQRIWSARSNEGSDYDLMHSRMMERIELERWRIVRAALAVGDEGIREGAEAFTEDEIRNELYRREEAGRDARVPLTMPVRFHPFSNADLRSMLPTPPSRGEGE